MNEKIVLTLDQLQRLAETGKALGSETRIAIIQLLQSRSLNVKEIADKLRIPISTAASNIKLLEDAGLIITNYQPGVRGSMKLCGRRVNEITILLDLKQAEASNVATLNMPVGAFTDCSVRPTCGMASRTEMLCENSPGEFFNAKRMHAQLLWFARGFVEYKFPNSMQAGQSIKRIELSAEVCSEAPKYRMDWPSDITVWLNGVDIGTWLSPGDFGDRPGANNPDWWPEYNTQYGLLKCWSVDEQGAFLDGKRVSGVTLAQIPNLGNDQITVRIGIGEDAKNIGGVNLFGEAFGDYGQNITMKIEYQSVT